LRGCRRQLPEGFTALMKDVGARRCASCHEQAGKSGEWLATLPDSFFVRIDHPERNAFLAAPLAKAAGGTEACGAVVFKTTDDPDYRRIAASFGALQKKLKTRPRLDMMSLEDQKVTSACPVSPTGGDGPAIVGDTM
jgi:hypothetical protein